MKPQRTITDYIVGCLSPLLIMLLVGSLVFFLIQVFYHGKMAASLRWVMFWFVMGIVLVTRIGMEEGIQRAVLFGLGLALATSLYLVRTNPAFLFGILLLAVVWWCAHKLTWNCTFVDEDEDASGQGLMDTLPDVARRRGEAKKTAVSTAAQKSAERFARLGNYFVKAAAPQTPGLWVIYFSAAASPLFGIGQTLLAADDAVSRRFGFVFMVAYLAAALGLFLTTSFLGLRRYLRQRYLRMPRAISLGWLRFGGGMIFAVFALAFLLPRPGSDYNWKTVAIAVDARLQRASDYATQLNPHGQGNGRVGNEPGGSQQSGEAEAKTPEQQQQNPTGEPRPGERSQAPRQNPATALIPAPTSGVHNLFRVLFLVVLALLIGWWVARNHQLILQAIKAFIQAVKDFFGGLSEARQARKTVPLSPTSAPSQIFASYQNPFATGVGGSWSPEQIVVYTYEAVQAWAREHGVEFQPQQTPREFCTDLGGKHPEIGYELGRLTIYYAHAAYGTQLPANYDVEPLRQIWRHLSG